MLKFLILFLKNNFEINFKTLISSMFCLKLNECSDKNVNYFLLLKCLNIYLLNIEGTEFNKISTHALLTPQN